MREGTDCRGWSRQQLRSTILTFPERLKMGVHRSIVGSTIILDALLLILVEGLAADQRLRHLPNRGIVVLSSRPLLQTLGGSSLRC